jgi:hypothetical protein
MPVIQLSDDVLVVLAEVGWAAAGVLLGALILGVRERLVMSTIGVAALHGVITFVLAIVLQGPYGVSPWIPILVSALVMVVLVEIFFETGWPHSIAIGLIGLAVADWQLFLELVRAIPG